jgi:hypothetical protein
MKKTILALLLSLLLLVAFGPNAHSQIAKQGTYSITLFFSTTAKVLPLGKERLQINYEFTGVTTNDAGKGFMHNASCHCLGAVHAVKGTYENDFGSVVFTCPDGDQALMTYQATGELGGMGKGTFSWVGGTGKLTGLEGSGEFTRFHVHPAAEGTFQGYFKLTGNWKLP